MAINQQLWTKDFAANLYEELDWYSFGVNNSDAVNNGIVHIPQAVSSSVPVEVTGSTFFPLAVGEQTYDDLTFTMKMIAAAPKYVYNVTASEASFDTRSELMKDIVGKVKQAISIEIANAWTVVSTGSTINCSGTARTNIYGMTGCTSLTFADVLSARAKLIQNTKSVDLNNLYLIVDPILFNDIVKLDQFNYNDKLAGERVAKGYVGEIGGFKVIQRPLGNPITNAGAKATISYTDTHDDTHYSSALAIVGDFVTYANGTVENGQIKMGVEPYATGYYNDVLQAHTRVGASPFYKVETTGYSVKGIVTIIEANSE